MIHILSVLWLTPTDSYLAHCIEGHKNNYRVKMKAEQ